MYIQMGRIQKCISITEEAKQIAEDNDISWTDAARVGMGLMLAEKGVQDYNNELNIYRKMTRMRVLLEKVCQEYNQFKEKSNGNNTRND